MGTRALLVLVAAGIVTLTMATPLAAAQAPAPAPGDLPPRPDPKSVARPEQTRIKVTSLDIHGADRLGAGRVASELGTRSSSWIPWGRKRYFDRKVFDADIKRIETYYHDRGYPDAKVTAFEAKLNDPQDAIAISITVSEGEPVRVDHVTLNGFDDLQPQALLALRRRLPLTEGSVLDRAQVAATTSMATRALQDRGYPLALVVTEETPVVDKRVTLTLNAKPGMEARFGAVSVSGNLSVGEDVIKRSLAFQPGTRFSLATLQVSQRRLYDLGLFQIATLAPRNDQAAAEGIVPVQITVAEAKHKQIRLSGGYGSEEKARGEAQWKHVNFLGGARTLSVQGKWSSLDRGVRVNFKQPYLFSPRVSLTLSPQAWYTNEPAYWLNSVGGRGTINYELTRRNVVSGRGADSAVSLSIIAEQEDYEVADYALQDPTFYSQLISLGLDPITGEAHGLLSALALDLRRTNVSNPLDANRGYLLQAHMERAGGWLPGAYTYQEYTAEMRHYLRMGRLGVVANRVRAGTIDAPDEAGVPFFKRYFLGGSNSLRGWGRFEVSDLSPEGNPLGGFSMLEFSSELRTPIFGKFTAVAFFEGGNATLTPWKVPFSSLRYDAGPGLRYLTPVGPLRIDMGFQINPTPELLVDGTPQSHSWRIHFSIGQAF
jgi:outer membrane protein insertion porin family/translocation and assembly module TamA